MYCVKWRMFLNSSHKLSKMNSSQFAFLIGPVFSYCWYRCNVNRAYNSRPYIRYAAYTRQLFAPTPEQTPQPHRRAFQTALMEFNNISPSSIFSVCWNISGTSFLPLFHMKHWVLLRGYYNFSIWSCWIYATSSCWIIQVQLPWERFRWYSFCTF